MKRALSYPLKLIAKNAGVNGSVVSEKVYKFNTYIHTCLLWSFSLYLINFGIFLFYFRFWRMIMRDTDITQRQINTKI